MVVREYNLSNWLLTGISGVLFLGAAVVSTREVNNKRAKVSFT